MTNATMNGSENGHRLNAILLPLMKAMEEEQPVDRDALLAAHPQFAAELEDFFAGHDCIERLHGREFAKAKPAGPARDLGQLGDFRLLREVGRGGMGVVYEAQQVSLDRCVALKVLPFAASLDPRQLQRFKNEAHAAALLHHPHIVPIYSVGSDRDVHYYAMQFIQGRCLSDMIRGLRQGPNDASRSSGAGAASRSTNEIPTARLAPAVPSAAPASVVKPDRATPAAKSTALSNWRPDYFRRVAEFGIQAAEALEHAHLLGVVHRDIKPANLLVDLQGKLWITDFGVALLRCGEGMTTTGEVVGTLRYMSPEQASAERRHIDHRTDIYSLGATLYELLTLQPAFPGNDPNRLLQEIAALDPTLLRTLDPAIPVELELIVLKALAKTPADRYASAQEMADDLRRFLEDKPIHATRPNLVDRAMKWSRRNRALVVSGLALLVLTTLGLFVSTVLVSRSQRHAQAAYEREMAKAQEAEQQRLRAEKNLAQARQVVDFLTKVSAEEMSDKPDMLPVREKLLTAALRYYEQFVEEHQGDPSIRAELEASRTQVKQILNLLAAQQDYTRFLLEVLVLQAKEVKHELEIEPRQMDKLWSLFEQVNQQGGENNGASAKLSLEERSRRFRGLADRNEKLLAAILTPAQGKRLKQIVLQQYGVLAFAKTEVTSALALTAEQNARIRRRLEEFERDQQALFTAALPPREVEREARRSQEQAEANMIALLNPVQKAIWKDLVGDLFDDHLPAQMALAFGPSSAATHRPPPPPPPPPPAGWDGPPDGPPREDGPKGKKDGPPRKK